MNAQIWQQSPRRIASKMAPVTINEITKNCITIKYKDNCLTVFGDTKYKDVYAKQVKTATSQRTGKQE